MHDGRGTVSIDTPDAHYGPVILGLRGEHQVQNALVAVRLLEAAKHTVATFRCRETPSSAVSWTSIGLGGSS